MIRAATKIITPIITLISAIELSNIELAPSSITFCIARACFKTIKRKIIAITFRIKNPIFKIIAKLIELINISSMFRFSN